MPNDPIILFSYINTKLSDTYSSLEELCRSECVEPEEIIEKLSSVGYEYDKNHNRFV